MNPAANSIKSIVRRLPFGSPFMSLLHNLRFAIARARNLQLAQGPLTYNQDGLATRHNCDFIKDERFSAAYRVGAATNSWGGAAVHWRVHTLLWAASIAAKLNGDFVECGVNRGGFSRAIVEFTNFPQLPKTFYLMDTFSGLVDEYISEEERRRGARGGMYAECYDQVIGTFSGFPNITIIKGPIPDTLPKVTPTAVAFLSIDMNCVAPEIAAAEYFWPRMTPGGIIVLDDYGWAGFEAQKRAFDTFAKQRGVEVLSLPTGQGIIVAT